MNTIKARGVTLLEMLVTLLILSIGLLGVAALQVKAQQYHFASYIRTQATMLGYEIIEKIQVNGEFARDDVIDDGDGDNKYITPGIKGYIVTVDNLKAIATPNPDCDTSNCTAEELRNYDLFHWHDRLKNLLPEGKASISVTVTPDPPDGVVAVADDSFPSDKKSNELEYLISIKWGLRDNERETEDQAIKEIQWKIRL